MAYSVENRIGGLSLSAVDTGHVPAGGGAAVPTSPAVLGQIVRGTDPVLGDGEFICLKGCAGTVVGSCVVWDGSFATSLCPATANQSRPVAFAMSPNISPLAFGFYQISGQCNALKDTSAAVNAGVPVGIVSAGAVGNSAAGLEISGARSTNTAQVLAATTVLPIYIDRPNLQGRIT
jgi:hypothetical protein